MRNNPARTEVLALLLSLACLVLLASDTHPGGTLRKRMVIVIYIGEPSHTTVTLPPLPSLTAAEEAIEGPEPVRPSTGQPEASTGPSGSAPPSPTWGQVFEYWAARLPGTYVVEDPGTWGATIVPPGTLVHIAPRTPYAWLPSIMKHESMHVRQHAIWGDNVDLWRAALAPYGGIEEVADCGARILGATKFSYTATCTADQTRAANAVLSGVAP